MAEWKQTFCILCYVNCGPEVVTEGGKIHLTKQHRSTWTHEIDLRAFSDRAWWNH
jgi:hypothetical protein